MKAWELVERGWCQGDYERTTSKGEIKYCALGALEKAYGMDPGFEREGKVENAVCAKWPAFNSVGQWNDAPERTKEEVVALLKELDL